MHATNQPILHNTTIKKAQLTTICFEQLSADRFRYERAKVKALTMQRSVRGSDGVCMGTGVLGAPGAPVEGGAPSTCPGQV